jgi:YVTN family beta-propeller protein
MPPLASFTPIRYLIPWPEYLLRAEDSGQGVSFLDLVGITDFNFYDRPSGESVARAQIALLDEAVFQLPGLDGCSVVFGAPDRAVAGAPGAEFDVDVELGLPLAVQLLNLGLTLRINQDVLKPVERGAGGKWVPSLGSDGKPRPFEIRLTGMNVGIDGDGDLALSFKQGAPAITIDAFMIADTGIVVEADQPIQVYLSRKSPPPPGKDPGFRGVHIPHASIHLPEMTFSSSPVGLEFTDCYIGSGGFSGSLAADLSLAGELFGVPFALRHVGLTFDQSVPVASDIRGLLLLPFFDEPVEVEIGIDLGGGISVKLTSASTNGLYKLTKKNILELELDSIGFELKNGVFIAKLSGQLTPIPLGSGIKWPSFDVKELSIDSKGHVHMDGGWVSLPKSYSLDFHGVAKVAITKFGLGHTEDGRKYIGLSGHVELVKKAPAGASVEGLRIIWDDHGHIALTFNGIGVKFSVPNAIEFDGKVSYKEDNGVHKFTGELTVKLPKLNDLTLIGKAVFGTNLDASGKVYKFFAVYIEGNFGTGIPLGATGLSLYGLAGLFAINYAPDKPPEMMWYSIDKSKSWFHKPQTGVTDLVSKWKPEEGTLAVGLGVTLGTTDDNGHQFNGKFLLLMLFPGPVLMIEGRAAFLGKPSDLSGDVEPPFHALIVLDNRAGYFLIGLDAQWKNDKVKGELLEIHGSAEAYFNFHDPTQWHIWLGKRTPLDQRIQASFAHSFTANCYFMLDPKQLALGAWVGKNAHYGWGPVSADLQASMEANAVVSFKPAQLSAGVSVDGSLALKVFRFRFALGLHASLSGEVSEPFHIKGVVQITIKTKVKDFHLEVSFEWGPRVVAPDLTLPELKPILKWGVAHPKSSLKWPLEGGGAPPLVPVDCRPYVTFGYSIDDEISVGVNTGPSPGWMIIGDKSTGKGAALVRYRLTQLSLYQHDQLNPQEKLIAARPKPAGHPDAGDIYGSWAPASVTGGGTSGQNKLLLWEKNPLALTDDTASWNPWLASNLPNYPCPTSDSETICVDFQQFSPGKQLYGPWRSGQHLDFVVSWSDSLTHPIVPVSPAAGKRDRGLSFPGPSSRKRYRAYVSNGGDNTISLLDLETRKILASIPAGLFPRQVVLSPDGKRAFACHQNDNTVIAIDTATNQRIGAPIAVIQSPVSIAVTPDGSKAFVPSGSQPAMSVINPLTLQVIATVKLLGVANRAVVSPDGKKLYVMHGPNHAVSVVSTDSLAVTKVVAASSGPAAMAFHPALPRAWVTMADRGVVRLFDTSRDEFVALETPTGKFARDMAISPDGARLFVGNLQQSTVSVLDTLTLDVVADISVRSGPQGLEMTPDGSSLLVANNFDNSVTIVDPFKYQVVAEGIQAGKGTDSFAVIEAPPQMEYRAFVSNQTGNTVAVLDLQTGKTLASIAVGKTPRMVAITLDQKRVCVCNSEDGTLTIIDAVNYSVVGSPFQGVKQPISIAISPDGKKAFVGGADHTMSAFDLAGLKPLSTISLPGPADAIVLSRDGKKGYVTHWPVHALSVFSTQSLAVTKTASAPGAPQSIALHPSLPLAFASFPDTGSVRIFDTATEEFTSIEVKTGKEAQDLCFSPDGSRLYVANLNENTVSVIETATNRVIAGVSVPGPKSPVFTSDGSMLVVASYIGNNVTLIDPSTNSVLGTPIRSDGFNNSVALAGAKKEGSPLSPLPFEVTIDVPRGSSSIEVTWSGKGPLHGDVPGASAPQNEITATAGSLLIFSAGSFGLGKQGIDQIRLRSDSEWTLISVCITKPAMEGGLGEHTRVEDALKQQIALWYKPAPVLEPEKDYRLVVEVQGEAVGMGELNGWSASLSDTRAILFHTVLPPGLGNVDSGPNQATGLEDLSLYIDRTIPVTQIAKNELPALTKPVFRGYDVTVEFNESYVDQMYQLANRDLDLLFFDRNNQPVRDASGALIVVEDPWANAPEMRLTETQALWISMSSKCAASVIDPKLIPTNKVLRAVDAHVLEGDTVYEARLVPRLMRQPDVSGPRWTTQAGAGAAALLVLMPPSSSGPDAWTDYRVSVLVLIGSADPIGIPFRFASGSYYEFVIDPGSNKRQLTLVQGSQTTLLKEDSYGYHPGKDDPFRIHIEAIGPNLLVTQNGEAVFSVSDTTLVAGGAGVRQPATPTIIKDFGLSDLRAGAPVAFRFHFTTSIFASFYHQIHSYQDEVWRVALDPASGGANLAARAVPASQAVSDPEVRAYTQLASLVLGPAHLQDPPQIEVTRVETGGAILGWLLRGPEPFDWVRTEITVSASARAAERGVPPRTVKIVEAEFGDSESVTVLAREQADLSGYAIQYLQMPAAIADEQGNRRLWKAGNGSSAQVSDGAVAGDPSWTDYRASLVCRSSQTGGVGLRFRYVDEKNYYLFTYDSVSGSQRIVKLINGGTTVLKEAAGAAAPGRPIRLTVSVLGPRIMAYRMTEKVFDISDSAFAAGGAGAFAAGNPSAQFDSFEVRRLPNESYSLLQGQFSTDAITGWQTAPDGSALKLKAIGSGAWTEVILRARIRRVKPGTAGLLLRYQDPSNHYRLLFTDSDWRIERVVKGVNTLLWKAAKPLPLDRLLEITVCLEGKLIRVFRDSVLACELTENALSSGSLGLCTSPTAELLVPQLVVYPATLAFSGWNFRDDFQGLFPGGWRFVDEGDRNGPAQWQLIEGRLVQKSDIQDSSPDPLRKRGAVALVRNSNLNSFRLVTGLLSTKGDAIGVVFGYQDQDNYYRFSTGANPDYRRLLRSKNGSLKVLWEDSVGREAGRDYAFTLDVIDGSVTGWLDGEQLFNIVVSEEITGSVGLYCCANPGASFGEFRIGAPAWIPYYTFRRELPLPAGNRIQITPAAGSAPPNPRTSMRSAADLDDPPLNRFAVNGDQLRVVGPDDSVYHSKQFIPTADYAPIAFRMLREADGTGVFLKPDAPVAANSMPRLSFSYHRKMPDPASIRFTEAGDDRDERVYIDLAPAQS